MWLLSNDSGIPRIAEKKSSPIQVREEKERLPCYRTVGDASDVTI